MSDLSTYAGIMRIYDERRLANARLQEERTEAVLKKLPQIADFDEEIRSAAGARVRCTVSGDAAGAKAASEKLASLREERAMVLKSAGFAADETDLHYTCERCRDTGIANGDYCDCFKRELVKARIQRSNMSDVLAAENFNIYTDKYYSDEMTPEGITVKKHMTDVALLCEEYAKTFKAGQADNLLFTGNAGVGKTFFARCIAAELLKRGENVVYTTASGLAATMNAGLFHDRDSSVDQEIKDINECALLIIDDMGTECPTARTISQLFGIIDERQIHGRATLITTNLSPENIRDIYSDRVFSRIIGGYRLVEMIGDDIRIRRAYS